MITQLKKFCSERIWLLGCIAVLFSSIPLLTKSFTFNDWINHTWMIDYDARYFLNHFQFPSVYNTDRLVGMGFPIFYSYLFYRLLALPCMIFTADYLVRALAIVLFACQFALAFRTLLKLTSDRLFSFSISAVTIWAIYPLTNLYHREAIPEFFATGMLTCAVLSWIQAICGEGNAHLKRWANLSILCLCGAAGAHPITSIYGSVFFSIMLALTMLLKTKHKVADMFKALIVPALISCVCMSPWLMAAGKSNRHLTISQTFHVIGFWRMTIDNWWMRISPIPIPYRFLAEKAHLENMTTRHLDAQINMPLLLCMAGMCFAFFKQRALPARIWAAVALLTSIAAIFVYYSGAPGFDRMGYIARCIQFIYRLVTYINLSMLIAILLSCAHRYLTAQEVGVQVTQPAASRKVLLTALTVSLIALAFKIGFTFYFRPISNQVFAWQRNDAQMLTLPKDFYGFRDYTMTDYLQGIDKETPYEGATFVPLPGKHFGEVQPLKVPLTDKWVATSAEAARWNHLLIDGKEPNKKQLSIRDDFLACKGFAGHEMTFEFKPDPIWGFLNQFAFWIFFTWLSITGASWIKFNLSKQNELSSAQTPSRPITNAASL